METEIQALLEVTKRLDRIGVSYMLTGSMALALYATPRMTRDLDLVLALNTEDCDAMQQAFEDDFYLDARSIRQAVRDKGMFNLLHTATALKIDCIVRKDDP